MLDGFCGLLAKIRRVYRIKEFCGGLDLTCEPQMNKPSFRSYVNLTWDFYKFPIKTSVLINTCAHLPLLKPHRDSAVTVMANCNGEVQLPAASPAMLNSSGIPMMGKCWPRRCSYTYNKDIVWKFELGSSAFETLFN